MRNPKLAALFDFIVRYKSAHDGNSPTVREIADALGISSTSVTHHHLGLLERAGKIRLLNDVAHSKARGIHVVGGEWTYHVPEA